MSKRKALNEKRVFVTRPCENCPYRMDAPRKLWDRAEFVGVLEAEQSLFGRIYSCHKQAKLSKGERGFCAGWLLDQKRRDIPSIALRIELAMQPDAVAALDAVNADGLEMFRTVEAMCRANGVRSRPSSPAATRAFRVDDLRGAEHEDA